MRCHAKVVSWPPGMSGSTAPTPPRLPQAGSSWLTPQQVPVPQLGPQLAHPPRQAGPRPPHPLAIRDIPGRGHTSATSTTTLPATHHTWHLQAHCLLCICHCRTRLLPCWGQATVTAVTAGAFNVYCCAGWGSLHHPSSTASLSSRTAPLSGWGVLCLYSKMGPLLPVLLSARCSSLQ